MLAQARPVRTRTQGQQVAVQQEAVPEHGVQAERSGPQCQPPEEERLARIARFQPRLERRQRERENEHERHHGEGKVQRAGMRDAQLSCSPLPQSYWPLSLAVECIVVVVVVVIFLLVIVLGAG